MNETIFREYDIRGNYPGEVNEKGAYVIGRSYGSYIKEKFNQDICIVSRDNRLSGKALRDELVKGLIESGCSVIDYGITTTPMNFYARHTNKLFGIMITASHNPKDDNGFKFSFGGPANAKGQEIKDFREYTFRGKFINGLGSYKQDSIDEKYTEYIKSGINIGKKKLKIVVDCGNGATTVITRKVFEKFNIDLEIINEEDDATFPNHHPDPAVKENLIQLKEKVLSSKADLGIAYDGDGDRIGFVKNNGDYLSTEEYMIIMSREILKTSKNKKILFDVKCSKVLGEEITKAGGDAFMYQTGASYTQAKTHEDDLAFGGEFSGHVFLRDRIYDVGSALYASLRLVEVLSNTDKTIEELTSDIPHYYITEEIKIKTKEDIKFDIVKKVKKHCLEKHYPVNDIDGVKVSFQGGWALVRASNTGPNLILRAEADTLEGKENLEKYFRNLISTYNK